MKIRTRLSLDFTLLTAAFMLLVFLVIYFSFSGYLRRDFYSRLNDRALITANVFFEKDELTRRSFIEIQKKYQQILPEEQSFVYDAKTQQAFIKDSTGLVTPQLIARVLEESNIEFEAGNKQGVGIEYEDNEGDFIIITMATNVFGQSQLRSLLVVLAITYVGGLAIIFLLSRRFARKALEPIVGINADLKNIRSSNLDKRLKVAQNKDEINELSNNFNDLLERLEHSFDLQRSFVNNASHELRTPLTSIIGELEVMLSRPRDRNEYEDTMHSVLAEAEKLTQILNQLFELSSYDGNDARLKIEAVPLAELLAMLKDSWEPNGVDFVNDKVFLEAPAEEQVIIHANLLLLETAINNIVKNALKFSSNKPVEISVSQYGSEIELKISDNGVGIREADLPNIFQPFYRSENVRGYAGTGIGLSISQRIVQVHGGRITAASIPGEKTSFHIYLPIKNPF